MMPYAVQKTVLVNGEKQTKTEYKTHIEEREDFIKVNGKKKFDDVCKVSKRHAELQDIPIPDGFKWVWSHFLEIWRHCESDINGNRIFTPKQITDYSECFGVEFTVREKKEIMMFEEWAEVSISRLKKKEN